MGFLDNLSSMWNGTTPQLAQTPGASGGAAYAPPTMQAPTAGAPVDPFSTAAAPTPGAYMGQIQTPPQFAPTGQTGGGLLDSLRTPDSRGLTFGDKLWAAGSVLQGDSGGAASYLQNQRQMATQETDKQRAQRIQQQGLDALRNNVDPTTGQLNIQGYLKALPAGGDLDQGLAVRKALQPEHSIITPGAEGALDVARDPNTGVPSITRLAPRDFSKSLTLADGTPNYDLIRAQAADAKAKSDALFPNQMSLKSNRAPPKAGGAGGGALSGPQLKAALAARRAQLLAAQGG
jgi:hypothetical protein